MELYADQEEGKKLIINSIRSGNKRIGFAAPCSYGKTVLMANLVEGAAKKLNRVWIIVDSVELIDQTRETLDSFDIKSNVIQGIHEDTDYSGMVQVVTAQTITRRWKYFDVHPEWLPKFIMIDEFHIQYKAHEELMNFLPDVQIIGFSATPTSKGLGLKYSDLVIGTTVKQLLDDKRLSPVEGYACHTPDMKGVKTSQGDFATSDTEKKVNTKKIRGDIVANWLKLGENRKTLVFAVNVQHSIDIANNFADSGIITLQLDGRTNKELRKQGIEDFKNSDYKILVTVGIAIKGFNVVDIGCIVDAQPTKSLSRHIQKIGRGMRKNDVYKDCIILDHAGNLERNGFPEDYEPDALCMDIKGESHDQQTKEKLAKPCPKCTFLIPYGDQICPKCGFKRETQANIETESGTLKKIEKKLSPADKRHKEQTKDQHQEMWSSFLKIGKSKGHSSHLYKDYYGVWKKGLSDSVVFSTDDAYEKALNFKKAKNIAWANRKQ